MQLHVLPDERLRGDEGEVGGEAEGGDDEPAGAGLAPRWCLLQSPGEEQALVGRHLLGRGLVGAPGGGVERPPGQGETSHWGVVEAGSEVNLQL